LTAIASTRMVEYFVDTSDFSSKKTRSRQLRYVGLENRRGYIGLLSVDPSARKPD
jgi:hypothetical protein